jgi:hypothetical protein
MSKSSYQTNYLGMTSFDYKPIFDIFNEYFGVLGMYLSNINTPCIKCNDISLLKNDSLLIYYSPHFRIYRYGDCFLVSLSITNNDINMELFVTTDEFPQVIKDLLDVYYIDITTDEQVPPFTIKGPFMGNQICFYLDRYNTLTIYRQIDEGYIYTDMTVGNKKKFAYRKFLYNQGFTFKSKSNCSCRI